MTRDEALKIVSSHDLGQKVPCGCQECRFAKGILEGYERGVRDSAKICNKAKRWNGRQNWFVSTKTSMELHGLILTLLDAKEKKA